MTLPIRSDFFVLRIRHAGLLSNDSGSGQDARWRGGSSPDFRAFGVFNTIQIDHVWCAGRSTNGEELSLFKLRMVHHAEVPTGISAQIGIGPAPIALALDAIWRLHFREIQYLPASSDKESLQPPQTLLPRMLLTSCAILVLVQKVFPREWILSLRPSPRGFFTVQSTVASECTSFDGFKRCSRFGLVCLRFASGPPSLHAVAGNPNSVE